jgi:hypothetical protein
MTAVRTSNIKSFAILALMIIASFGISAAQADNPKPKPKPDTPTEVITLTFGKLEVTYRVDGSPGPNVNLEGVLHLGSKVLLSDDGVPIGFRLHGNLSDASALSADGATSFEAVGASDGVPDECEPEACAPPFWTFTFRLIPKGSGLQSSLLFDLTLSTQYDAKGTLTSVCVVGEENCNL